MAARVGSGRRATRAMFPACALAAMLVAGSPPASAQQLELTFDHGRVTLKADGVTARQILEEWARQGRTRVINADTLGDERVSIEFDALPEAQALGRILDSAAGYLARRRAGTAGPSDFALIVVSPTSEDARAAWATDPTLSTPEPLRDDDLTAVPSGEPLRTEAGADTDADLKISENERNGRSSDARPDPRLVNEGDLESLIPAEKLPSGRPDGARPGTPGALHATAPVTTPAPVTAQPGGQRVDANGRPVRNP